MIKITLTNKAIISSLTDMQKIGIKKIFTIFNPLFNRKMESGLSVWGVDKSLKYYRELNNNNDLEFPIGGMTEVLDYLSSVEVSDKDITIIDNRKAISDASYFNKFNFKGSLRNYQNDIITSIKDKTVGIIEAMTGSGKTITFIKQIFNLKVNALILVNTKELAKQAIDSLVAFSNLTENDIGFVGSGKFIIKPITVAIHQTIMRLSPDKIDIINNNFGIIIADEVHICAAELFYNNLTMLEMKYKFGYSATPKDRADGLSQVVFWATGPLLHTVPREDLSDSLMIPTLKIVNTDYYFPLFDTSDYTFMISDLSNNKERNEQIANYVLNTYKAKDDYVCVLCNLVSQVETLSNLIGDQATALTSKVAKKKRVKIMEDLNDKKIKYIVSTYALFGTGINVTHLNVLILAAPRKSLIILKQAAGRIMRKSPNKKTATIVDFVDKKIGLLRGQSKVRHRIFNKIGVNINAN